VPKEDDVIAKDLATTVTGGICAGITVTWIVGVLNGCSDAVSTGDFAEYFDNVLRPQGAYLQALHRREDERDENTGDFKMRKLAEILVHGCTKFDYKYCNVNKLQRNVPNDRKKPLWAAYVSIFHHAIGIARANNRLHVMDPNEGLFSYTHVNRFYSEVSKHITYRIKNITKKHPNKHGENVTPASEFNMTFWEKKS
jgi:hypothetical protein